MLRHLYHDEALRLDYDPDHRWLYADWQPRQDVRTAHRGCATLLHYARQQGCCKVLNDNRLVCTLWADAAEWVGTAFMRELSESGVQYFAWVYAQSIYGRLSINQALAYAEQPTIRAFDDYTAAANWLDSCRD
ncbi:hypothetical protein [Hymenobacter jeollabukensis]|uniref:STAS/SEC14 domain-containing protein n=1 Tax=Hymenobacter jeollabukensis TaxID=2025313 RepID=A0A5R8WSQ2_9BACT|nr:hypothetical protein [Hymenobacter jeollabukensis]TLM94213.1 hypothetical protein FDY95_09375 [Hymenobacter jeollabukensis]